LNRPVFAIDSTTSIGPFAVAIRTAMPPGRSPGSAPRRPARAARGDRQRVPRSRGLPGVHPRDQRVRVANLIRRALPAAGIFAVTDAAGPGGPWQPDEGLDGVVPRALDDAVVRGFLYANFLRPLVVRDGAIAHTSGFLGPPTHLPAYLALLTRALVDRCTGLDPTLDLQIDLTRMPDDAGAVTAVLAAVNRELRATGAAPAFRLGPAVHAAVAGRLPGAVALRA
jgi:hypothetical protein